MPSGRVSSVRLGYRELPNKTDLHTGPVSTSDTLLPLLPADSELAHWIEAGQYREPADSDIMAVEAPDELDGLRAHLGGLLEVSDISLVC